MRGILAAILLSVLYIQAVDGFLNKCSICIDIANRAKKSGSDSESVTRAKALMAADSYTGDSHDFYVSELNCHWDKYYSDANFPLMTTFPAATCGDTACCPASYQISNNTIVDKTGTNTHFTPNACVVPKVVLLHHTVTETIGDTLNVFAKNGLSVQYIVARNGTVYQLFNDAVRAWHAGNGKFGNVSDVNTYSVGIEIVNHGDEAFDPLQIEGVKALVKTLKLRWRISDTYVIGHMEIAPGRKSDPSGWFPWSGLDDYLGIFPGLYNTNLTSAQQAQVIFNASTVGSQSLIHSIQNKLKRWGYDYLPMTAGVVDENTKVNIQSFNRRYVPELFIKEKIIAEQIVFNPANEQWYKLSDERLNKLFVLSAPMQ
ncbi:unnamed protein product [Auanema sp. JU1783]|nr:unnamed protein product [Auanema sp. JU1783]